MSLIYDLILYLVEFSMIGSYYSLMEYITRTLVCLNHDIGRVPFLVFKYLVYYISAIISFQLRQLSKARRGNSSL